MPALKTSRRGVLSSSAKALRPRVPLCEHFYANGFNAIASPNVACHSMGSGLVPVSSETLRQYLERGSHALLDMPLVSETMKPLLLDCRPFLVHGESHIAGAVNVHCPAILR